ncbi:MAG TPA: glycerophosphodiester phosphodiesterase family protein, partial [Acidimicrobiales bacterium]
MATRIAPLLQPQIGFAHRGARAHARENTIEAFELALRLGATGVETDAWLTRDGQVVLDHDGVVGRLFGKRRIREVDRADLPRHIPTLPELYEAIGTDVPISIDVKDHDAAGPIIEIARGFGPHAVHNLWLCAGDLDVLASFRELDPAVRLVDSTRLKNVREGPERRAARLVELGIDAINLHYSDWTGGLTTLFHRFERYAFTWD